MRRISFFIVLTFAAGVAAQHGEPPGVITLDEAMRLALTRNPSLSSARLEVEARYERARQQSRLPNPAFLGAVENAGAESTSRETTASVQQLIELGGDRGARTAAALRSRDVAAQELAFVRASVVGQVRRAFTSVLAGQEKVTIARENLELAQSTAETIRARVEAGKVSPIEETRADVLEAAERLELVRAEQRLGEARRQLAATWGGDRPAFESASGDLTTMTDLPPFDSLRDRLDQHPALVRATAAIAEREAIVALEQARRIPDVTASAGHRRFTSPDDSGVVASISIPLPLFDRNRAAIAEAMLRVAQAREEARAVRVALERDLGDAYRAYQTAKQEVTTLQEEIVPAAHSVFDAISEGYRLGKFGYLEVLDARRTLTSARLQLARALEQLHLAAASVEQLTTHEIPTATGETR